MTAEFEPARKSALARGLPYAAAMLLVAAVTIAGSFGEGRLSLANLALFYLLPVMLVSGRAGLAPGLFTSALAALAFNFFLVPPRFTLRIADADNLVTLTALFVVAVVVSQLASRLRHQAERAEASARTSAILAEFGERIAQDAGSDAILAQLEGALARTLDVRVAANPAELTGIDAAAANWAVANNVRTGRGTSIMATAEWLFAPLVADREPYGLIAIARDDAQPPLSESQQALFDGLLDRAAHALARVALTDERDAIDRHRQREQLREALLASVGHDLRTPLTAIRAGLDALHSDAADPSIIASVRAQTGRLDLMVANLLEMTRIEAGAVALRMEPTDLTDVVAAAVGALAPQIGTRALVIELPDTLPLVRSDPRLLHPMLLNLIDNACKHGGEDATITIRASSGPTGVTLSVADSGAGIPVGEEARIFERFARIAGSDRSGGTGLGLAIVRGFGDALGIATSAANGAGGGAVFSVIFPPAMMIAASSPVVA